MLSARDMTADEAAKDFITALWVMRLKEEQGRLDATSTPENDGRRLRLSTLMKALRNQPWEKARLLMTPDYGAALTPEARPRGLPLSAPEAAAAPCGRAVDSASGAGDPEEFPPSAYPPDETPD